MADYLIWTKYYLDNIKPKIILKNFINIIQVDFKGNEILILCEDNYFSIFDFVHNVFKIKFIDNLRGISNALFIKKDNYICYSGTVFNDLYFYNYYHRQYIQSFSGHSSLITELKYNYYTDSLLSNERNQICFLLNLNFYDNNLNNNFEQKIKLESKFENTSHMIFNNSGSIIIKTFYNHINGLTYFFKYNRKSDGNKFFITDEDIEFNKELPKTNKLVIKLEIIKERFIVCLKENGNISIFNLFLYEIKNIDNNQIYIDFEKVPGTFFFITTNKNYKHELYDLNLEENNVENNENFIIKFQEPILYKYIKFSKDVGCFVAYEDNLTFFVPEI